MVRQGDKHSTVQFAGERNNINLDVVSTDPTTNRITVECNVCHRRFGIGRSSLRNERQLARKLHSSPVTSAVSLTPTSKSATPAGVTAQPSTVVAATGEGRRYLKGYCKVDDVVLSVHREPSADGTYMLHAKTIDQKLMLLGRELPQAQGYPRVMYRTGSTLPLDEALRRCREGIRKHQAAQHRTARLNLEEDRDWREMVQAFHLICNPNQAPRIQDCTGKNIEKCLDLLTGVLPIDYDNPVLNCDGDTVGHHRVLARMYPRTTSVRVHSHAS